MNIPNNSQFKNKSVNKGLSTSGLISDFTS